MGFRLGNLLGNQQNILYRAAEIEERHMRKEAKLRRERNQNRRRNSGQTVRYDRGER
jgi:hypothetical protein